MIKIHRKQFNKNFQQVPRSNIFNKRSDLTSAAIERLQLSRGFTLVEILISAAIFVTTLSIAIATFSSSNVVQVQNQLQRDITRTGLSVMESINRDVRLANGTIAGNLANIQDQFTLSDDTLTINYNNGEEDSWIIYRYDIDSTSGRGTIKYSTSTNTEEQDLLDSNVSIVPVDGENTIFFNDAYSNIEAAQVQPNLQIKYKIENADAKRKTEEASLVLQTTVTTRSYPGFNQ